MFLTDYLLKDVLQLKWDGYKKNYYNVFQLFEYVEYQQIYHVFHAWTKDADLLESKWFYSNLRPFLPALNIILIDQELDLSFLVYL